MHPSLAVVQLLVVWGVWWYLAADLPFSSVVFECACWYCLKCAVGLLAAANPEGAFPYLL